MIISHATTAFLLHVVTSVKHYNLLNPVFEPIRSPLQMAAHYAVNDARSCQAIQSQIQTTYESEGEDSTRACLDCTPSVYRDDTRTTQAILFYLPS
jgi:hypothetical protein